MAVEGHSAWLRTLGSRSQRTLLGNGAPRVLSVGVLSVRPLSPRRREFAPPFALVSKPNCRSSPWVTHVAGANIEHAPRSERRQISRARVDLRLLAARTTLGAPVKRPARRVPPCEGLVTRFDRRS